MEHGEDRGRTRACWFALAALFASGCAREQDEEAGATAPPSGVVHAATKADAEPDVTLLHLEGRFGDPEGLWGEASYKVKRKGGRRYRQLELDVEHAPPSTAQALALDDFALGKVSSNRKGSLEFEISEEDEAIFPAGFREPRVGAVFHVGELMQLTLGELVKETDLEAAIAGAGALTGKVGFKVERLGDVVSREFQVKVERAPKKSVHPVTIDGVSVGELMVDVEGQGKLKYSTKKLPAFPPGFPEVRAGAVVQVGELFHGALVDTLAPASQ